MMIFLLQNTTVLMMFLYSSLNSLFLSLFLLKAYSNHIIVYITSLSIIQIVVLF